LSITIFNLSEDVVKLGGSGWYYFLPAKSEKNPYFENSY